VSRPSAVLVGAIALLLAGCDQLGNPQQYATAPTPWRGQHGHVVTTTRSFKNEATIRRIVSEGMEDLDYADPSIGPSQTLTIVIVVPRTLRLTRRPTVKLVTTFRLQDRQPISRTWQAPSAGNKWSAAFALPEPPTGAVTVVAP
jgi:hypothetical protein